jgi:hypothetical protein
VFHPFLWRKEDARVLCPIGIILCLLGRSIGGELLGSPFRVVRVPSIHALERLGVQACSAPTRWVRAELPLLKLEVAKRLGRLALRAGLLTARFKSGLLLAGW